MMVDLPDAARRALERARGAKLSYAVHLVRAPDGRLVAILGEAHLKMAAAAAIGKQVVGSFELRGVETFQRARIVGGRALGIVINVPRLILRALSLGLIKGSTITDAKQLPDGHTVELERSKHMPFGLHVSALYMTAFFVISMLAAMGTVIWTISPILAMWIAFAALLFQAHLLFLIPGIFVRRWHYSWIIHPFLGILTLRDELMAQGTVQMLEDHPEASAAVVVMGRAHVTGYERLLVERHGFTSVPWSG